MTPSDDQETKNLSLKSMARLTHEIWKLLSGHKISIVFLALLVGIQAGLNVGGAAALKYLLDGFAPGALGRVYLAVPLAVAGVLVTLAYVGYGVSILANITGERIVANLREDSFSKLLGLSQSFFDTAHSASLSSRIINDLSWVRQAIRHLYREGFAEPVVILSLGAYLAYLNVGLLALSLTIFPFFAIPVWRLGRKTSRIAKDLMSHHADRAVTQQESLAGAAVIRAAGAKEVFSQRFADKNRRVLDTWISLYKTSGLIHPVGMTLAAVAFAGVSVMGYHLLISGSLGPGTYGAFLGGLVLFFRASARLGRQAASFLETLGALDQIIHLREKALAETERTGKSSAPNQPLPDKDSPTAGSPTKDSPTIGSPAEDSTTTGSPAEESHIILVESLGFRYGESGPKVLENINLRVQTGEIVALLGESGSGKSTLLKIILGFYRPQSGCVTIRGKDPQEMSSSSISRLMGYLDQEASLFDDTIGFNLTLGRDAKDEDIWVALEQSRLAEFVKNLDKKLETNIGESGHRLSMGQRRRLALARCLLGEPSVLLLDEPTTSLDKSTASTIMNTIKEMAANGKTILLATHKNEIASQADRTIVLNTVSPSLS